MINSNAMSKYSGIVIGIIAVFIGLKGLIAWHGELIALLKGSLPAVFILVGAIAVIAGLSEIKDEISAKREEKR